MTSPVTIACVQSAIEVVDDVAEKESVIDRNLTRSLNLAEGAIARDGANVLVFPEAWLQGNNYTRSSEEWRAVCLQIPGPETELIGQFCQKHGVYIAGAAYEQDPDWPEVWFSTGFIVGPSGNTELRYRKIQERNVEGRIPNTSPADVYEEYLQRYGKDSAFPVLDTPFGRLAVIVENDVNFFELTRVFTFHGAEIFLHPTSEENSALNAAWDQARRSRCYENLCYLATANVGRIVSRNTAEHATRGGSSLIDFLGNVAADVDGPGESVLAASADLQRLRQRRTEVRMNFPAQVKSELFAKEFAKKTLMPTNQGPATRQMGEANIRRLQEEGIIATP